MDKLADNINEELIKKSELWLSDLSIKYELGSNFLSTTIRERLGTVIDGLFTPDGTKLLTQGYLKILKSQIKGLMRSQWGPCNILQISKKHNLEEGKVNQF